MPDTENLTPAELVKRWNNAVTVGTLSNWRSQGRGPAFVKFGRSIRYPLSGVQAYEAENMRVGSEDKKA